MNQPSFNPYAAPSAEADVELARGFNLNLSHLATPGQRWLGKFLDQLLLVGSFIPGIVLGQILHDEDLGMLVAFVPVLFLLAAQWTLIARSGQSLGKKAVKTRIVRTDGTNPGFVHGVLLRAWVPFMLQMVPAFGLVDALFVFRQDRRTIHDQIAGTSVIQI